MDIVYILGKGSVWKDNEIRYSLRSIGKHLRGFDLVFVVGELPRFLTNVIHIPCEDVYKGNDLRRNYNIKEKVLAACRDERVSGDFLFFNDDHFLLRGLDVSEVRYWSDGGWDEPILRAGVAYKRVLVNTVPFSKYHFDIHTPIVYNKKRFIERMDVDWSKEYAVKSLYCGNDFDPEFMKDMKVNARLTVESWKKLVTDRLFFSIGDAAVCWDFKQFMNELYPDKSKYEL